MGAVAQSANLEWPPIADQETVCAKNVVVPLWIVFADKVRLALRVGLDKDAAHDSRVPKDGMIG